jgi:hypothetical protein
MCAKVDGWNSFSTYSPLINDLIRHLCKGIICRLYQSRQSFERRRKLLFDGRSNFEDSQRRYLSGEKGHSAQLKQLIKEMHDRSGIHNGVMER